MASLFVARWSASFGPREAAEPPCFAPCPGMGLRRTKAYVCRERQLPAASCPIPKRGASEALAITPQPAPECAG
eukprot:scaffold4735_cov403-Prasinococcus_capsulatus_cf.AAC.6